MCNLYALTTPIDAMRRTFDLTEGVGRNLAPAPAIFPGMTAPVVRPTPNGRALTDMSWGFVLPQGDKAPKRVTNARDDKLRLSRFWTGSFEARRCLAPASSFCEPKGKRPAVWHWFASADGASAENPRPPFAFAAIWRSWRGRLKDELVELETYALVTTRPNAVVSPIHPTRMPAILTADMFETWLHGDPDEAFALIGPAPDSALRIVRAGPEKADPLEPGDLLI